MGGKRYRRPYIPPSQENATVPEGSITRVQAEYFSGPLPPPETLARYNSVVPNGAERILAMAERQSAHREKLESQVVAGNISSQKLGSTYAFVLSFIAIAGGLWVMYEGKSVWGLAPILADLAALAGVFVLSRNRQAKERTDKATALAKRSGH